MHLHPWVCGPEKEVGILLRPLKRGWIHIIASICSEGRLWNHGIVQYLELERTHKDHLEVCASSHQQAGQGIQWRHSPFFLSCSLGLANINTGLLKSCEIYILVPEVQCDLNPHFASKGKHTVKLRKHFPCESHQCLQVTPLHLLLSPPPRKSPLKKEDFFLCFSCITCFACWPINYRSVASDSQGTAMYWGWCFHWEWR